MVRGEFRELDHTADVGLELRGESPADLLSAALRGLMSQVLGTIDDLEPTETRTIELSAEDYPSLLKSWCERLYRLFETEGFVALDSDVDEIDPLSFRARVRGVMPVPERLAEATEIKAVTYHMLEFELVDEGEGRQWWRGRVVFDV